MRDVPKAESKTVATPAAAQVWNDRDAPKAEPTSTPTASAARLWKPMTAKELGPSPWGCVKGQTVPDPLRKPYDNGNRVQPVGRLHWGHVQRYGVRKTLTELIPRSDLTRRTFPVTDPKASATASTWRAEANAQRIWVKGNFLGANGSFD